MTEPLTMRFDISKTEQSEPATSRGRLQDPSHAAPSVFRPVTLGDKSLVDAYSFRFGENSCQHSFASMYGHFGKYGDAVLEKDGWLFVCREHLNTDSEKVYLCPMGDPEDEEGFRKALLFLLADAAASGKKAVFHTVTAAAKSRMEKALPGVFSFSEVRDYYEYIYSGKDLATLPGSRLSLRRRQCRLFDRRFGHRTSVEEIHPDTLDEVLDFQRRWMTERTSGKENPGLWEEDTAIRRELEAFDALGLSGILLRIDGNIAGYSFGVPLSEDCFDILCEKADRSVPYIYMALKREFPRRNDARFRYYNWEEDVGDPGLRTMKLRYRPGNLLEKFRAEEVR